MRANRTPLRQARAAALWRHLACREECIEQFVSSLPADHQEQARENVAVMTTMAGAYGALFMLGGPACETGYAIEEYQHYTDYFTEADALNVAAVTGWLVRESGWTRRDVETALDDLADDEAIRLVAERDSGDVGIGLLRRPEDER